MSPVELLNQLFQIKPAQGPAIPQGNMNYQKLQGNVGYRVGTRIQQDAADNGLLDAHTKGVAISPYLQQLYNPVTGQNIIRNYQTNTRTVVNPTVLPDHQNYAPSVFSQRPVVAAPVHGSNLLQLITQGVQRRT